MNQRMLIGTVLKTRGLKGEIKVKPFTDDIDNLLKVKNVYIDDINYKVLSSYESGGMVYLNLSKICSIEDAQVLRGKDIYIDRQDAAPLENGGYYIVDILGCDVYTGQKYIGKVVDIEQYGAADVYTVKGEKVVRFPYLRKLVIQIDIENKKIVLDEKVFEEVSIYED
ncbi:MAG TPA: ribosome maturation factor RimM [Clostridia bacterium]